MQGSGLEGYFIMLHNYNITVYILVDCVLLQLVCA